jgi:hypothetical protein
VEVPEPSDLIQSLVLQEHRVLEWAESSKPEILKPFFVDFNGSFEDLLIFLSIGSITSTFGRNKV